MARGCTIQRDYIKQKMVELLANGPATDLRRIYYKMTVSDLDYPVPKSKIGYNNVGRWLCELRLDGLVRYDKIIDNTRSGSSRHTLDYYDPAFDVARCGRVFVDPWKSVDKYVVVWCESRGTAAVLSPICNKYRVSLYPAGGQPSMTLVYEAAMAALQSGKKHLEVIHIGDYDKAGWLIEEKIEEKYRLHLGDKMTVDCCRAALHQFQIEEHKIPYTYKEGADGTSTDAEIEAVDDKLLQKMLETFLSEYEELMVEAGAEEDKKSVTLHCQLGKLAGYIKKDGLTGVLAKLKKE